MYQLKSNWRKNEAVPNEYSFRKGFPSAKVSLGHWQPPTQPKLDSCAARSVLACFQTHLAAEATQVETHGEFDAGRVTTHSFKLRVLTNPFDAWKKSNTAGGRMLNLEDWVTSGSLIQTKIVGWIKPFFLNVFESKVTIKGDLKTSFPALLSFKGVDALIPFFINIFSDPKHKPNLQVFRVQAFKSAMKTNHLRSHQSHHSQQRITKKTTEKQEAGVFFGLLFFCWFTCEISTSKIHPGSSTARPWKWMVGRMLEV